MKITYEARLLTHKEMHMSYTKSLINVLNQLDEINPQKDTKRYYELFADSHWLRSKIELLHQEIEYLENKLRGEK